MKRDILWERFGIMRLICAFILLAFTLRYGSLLSDSLSGAVVYVFSEASHALISTQKNTVLQDKLPTADGDADLYTESLSEDTDKKSPQAESTSTGYSTPEDVIRFEEEYLAAFSSSVAAGSTEEVFFSTSGATDTVSGISIKNATATKKPDFEALIKQGISLDIPDKSEPVVLIFHTHTTESYLLSDNGVFYSDYQTRSTDSSKNMIRVGDEICRVLEENGIGYIHDTKIYDEAYEGAYGRSRESVQQYLEEYPSIKIVLDVHRDAIYYSDSSRCKPTAEIDGKKAAQIMIITGTEEGYITDFPDWEENLKFALAFQETAEDMYKGLMKPLYFCQRKYNMDLGAVSLLFEMGTDANTLDEAMYSGYLAGNVLAEMINEMAESE